MPLDGTRWETSSQAARDAMLQYQPDLQCANFPDDNLLYEAPDGQTYQLACPATGVIYAPPLSAAALAEILFPDEWSIIPPG